MVKQVSVEELKNKMDSGEKIVLVDCREPDENQYCRIENSMLIPLSEFTERGAKELNKNAEIYIHCHHGGRSQRACEFLESQGFQNVANISGGIDAWSIRIDPKVLRY